MHVSVNAGIESKATAGAPSKKLSLRPTCILKINT